MIVLGSAEHNRGQFFVLGDVGDIDVGAVEDGCKSLRQVASAVVDGVQPVTPVHFVDQL